MTYKGFVDFIAARSANQQGSWIVTVNLQILGKWLDDPSYREHLSRADFFTPDGMPILWAVRRKTGLASTECERITGIDLSESFLKHPAFKSILLIGGKYPEKVARRFAIPEKEISTLSGKLTVTEEGLPKTTVAALQKGHYDLILVGLGVPKQDQVCGQFRREFPNATLIGVGCALDVLAGHRRRAPKWVQDWGFEWLFRLAYEPTRLWKRYLLEYPLISLRICKSMLLRKRKVANQNFASLSLLLFALSIARTAWAEDLIFEPNTDPKENIPELHWNKTRAPVVERRLKGKNQKTIQLSGTVSAGGPQISIASQSLSGREVHSSFSLMQKPDRSQGFEVTAPVEDGRVRLVIRAQYKSGEVKRSVLDLQSEGSPLLEKTIQKKSRSPAEQSRADESSSDQVNEETKKPKTPSSRKLKFTALLGSSLRNIPASSPEYGIAKPLLLSLELGLILFKDLGLHVEYGRTLFTYQMNLFAGHLEVVFLEATTQSFISSLRLFVMASGGYFTFQTPSSVPSAAFPSSGIFYGGGAGANWELGKGKNYLKTTVEIGPTNSVLSYTFGLYFGRVF